MPLHDWTDDRGWDSVHQLWINALLYWAQDRLPAGYRAYLGSVPGLSIGAEPGRPEWGNGVRFIFDSINKLDPFPRHIRVREKGRPSMNRIVVKSRVGSNGILQLTLP